MDESHSAFFKLASNPMTECRFDGTFLRINGAWEKQLGLGFETLRGKTLFDILPKEHQDKLRNTIHESLQERQSTISLPLEIKAGTGKMISFTLSGEANFARGLWHFALHSGVDSEFKNDTELLTKEAERSSEEIDQWSYLARKQQIIMERLAESEMRFEALSHTLPGIMFQISSDSNHNIQIHYVAPNAADLFELTVEEVSSSPSIALSMVAPKYKRELFKLAKKAAANVEQLRWQGQIIPKSGTVKWVSLLVTPRHSGATGNLTWDGLLIDMTAERDIRLQQRQLLSIAEASPEFVVFCTADGTISFLNKGFRDVCDLEVGENIFRDATRIFPENSLNAVFNRSFAFADNNGTWSGEATILDRTGHEIPVFQLLFTVLDEDGQIEYRAAILRDISSIKEKEKLLRDQQAQIASQSRLVSLGEMAGGIAHEINNPLGVVLAYAERLRELVTNNDVNNESVLKCAEKIEKTALRIGKIVTGLRSISRDSVGEDFEEISIQAIVNETLSLCSEKLNHQKIDLTVQLPAEPINLSCRSVQVCQVLLNLIVNAQHAIENLPEKWIQVTVLDHSDSVELRVTDSGGGIPEKIREKIFDPFFTTKGVGKGTGLGLSISAGLIKAHNGALSIDAQSPFTCFVISLPKKQARQEPVTTTSGSTSTSSSSSGSPAAA
jgi:PAS domain S-box-containing protein